MVKAVVVVDKHSFILNLMDLL